jgi:hypothetical protein
MPRERSERVRDRGMLTGSTITGGSSISLFVALMSESGGTSKDGRGLSSLSRLMLRNLDLRVCLGASGDMDVELPARLVTLVVESFADLDRSRFACFCRNLGSLEVDEAECREFLPDII